MLRDLKQNSINFYVLADYNVFCFIAKIIRTSQIKTCYCTFPCKYIFVKNEWD